MGLKTDVNNPQQLLFLLFLKNEDPIFKGKSENSFFLYPPEVQQFAPEKLPGPNRKVKRLPTTHFSGASC